MRKFDIAMGIMMFTFLGCCLVTSLALAAIMVRFALMSYGIVSR